MAWKDYEVWLNQNWPQALNSATDEKAIQIFLEDHPCLLPGATRIDRGGAHGPWWDAVVREPEFQGNGPKRRPDFMWIRRDTAATRPVFIEIEDPHKHWMTQALRPTKELTQAISQIKEWKHWFRDPVNQMNFIQQYVPAQFSRRTLAPVYVLVYGRRAEFEEGGPHENFARARQLREELQHENEHFFVYDDLKPESAAGDHGGFATITFTQTKKEIVAIPPTFMTGPGLLRNNGLLDFSKDISTARSPIMPEARKRYIAERWKYWAAESRNFKGKHQISLSE